MKNYTNGMKGLIFLLVGAFILCSCVTQTGTISSSSLNKPIKYQDVAFGISQSDKYFGLGGYSQDALVLEAKRNMMLNRPLGIYEDYANYTIDFKKINYLIYSRLKVTISADVVKYTNDTIKDSYSDQYRIKYLKRPIPNSLFGIGDSVIDADGVAGVIASMDTKRIRMIYKTKNDKIKSSNYSYGNIYSTNKSYNGLKIGELFTSKINKTGNAGSTVSGKIIGVGLQSLLIKVKMNTILKVHYK